MIKSTNEYLIAHYSQKPKLGVNTSQKGWMSNPNNIRWDEAMTITRGVRKRDRLAAVILDLTERKVVSNSFNTGRTFDEIITYYMENYTKQLIPVMMQLDPEYVQDLASGVKRAEVISETIQSK
jgi:hypothetical protein